MADPIERSPPAAVLFDMDGLLLDTERLHLETGVALGRSLGLGDLDAVLRSMIGIRQAEGRELLEPALRGELAVTAFDTLWHEAIAERLSRGVPVKSGAHELLAALRARGVPCAVATSTRRAQAEELLRGAGLRDLLVSVRGGDDVTRGKPDPEIYHLAAASLDVDASATVAFEDSNAGTRAAVASGALTVQVPDLVEPSAQVLRLGHVVAPDLMSGARRVGLLPAA